MFFAVHAYRFDPAEAAARSILPVGGVQPDSEWPDISFSKYLPVLPLASMDLNACKDVGASLQACAIE